MQAPRLGADGKPHRLARRGRPRGVADASDDGTGGRPNECETPAGFERLAIDQIRLADEVRDLGAVRRAVDFLGRADLTDSAASHHGHAVRHRERFLLVVGDINRGQAVVLHNPADLAAHFHAELGVEIGKRFVEQQALRFHDQRAGKRDALLLAAGHLVDRAGAESRQPDHFQNLLDPSLDFRFRHSPLFEAESDVLADGEMRPQRVALENHRRLALVRRHSGHVALAEKDRAAVRSFQPGDAAQQRRLAATRGPKQEKKLARFDTQADPVESPGASKGFDD